MSAMTLNACPKHSQVVHGEYNIRLKYQKNGQKCLNNFDSLKIQPGAVQEQENIFPPLP